MLDENERSRVGRARESVLRGNLEKYQTPAHRAQIERVPGPLLGHLPCSFTVDDVAIRSNGLSANRALWLRVQRFACHPKSPYRWTVRQ